MIWSRASWKVTPVRLTETFLSRKPSSKRMFTPAILARLSKIFSRLESWNLSVMGTGLRGASTGTGTRWAWALAFIPSKSASRLFSSSRLRIFSRTSRSSSEA